MDTKSALTDYERQLSFNALTAWLHSLRYRSTLQVIASVAEGLDRPLKVLEIGSAEGKLFGILDQRFSIDFTGIEIREDFIRTARARYGERKNFRVLQRSAIDLEGIDTPDVVIALETLEHIPENDVVRVVEAVAALHPKRFICSVPVEIGPSIWLKNVGSLLAGYNRHRIEYTWARTFWAGLYQLDRLPPHDTGHMGFDWRWLAQTIRHNMRICEMRRFPFRFLPAAVSMSIFMVAEPR